MIYQTSRIKEIQYEIKESHKDGDNDDDTVTALEKELKELRKKKKDAYQNWRVVTDAE